MKLTQEMAEVYYTAAEARKALAIDEEAFQYWGKTGRIKRVYLPGRKQPVYSKKEINKMATQINAIIIAEYPETEKFKKATVGDLEKEADLAVLAFGSRAHAIEARKTFLETNPDISYHLYDQNELVAYINIVPLKHQAIEEFMKGKLLAWNINPDDIEQFTPNHPLECLIIDMVTTPKVQPMKRSAYGARLLSGLLQTLAEAGKQGIEITKVYAASETDAGIRILRNAGFTELYQARKGRISFELDVIQSNEKILLEYQEALKAYKKRVQKL
jgi:hypothetical protein